MRTRARSKSAAAPKAAEGKQLTKSKSKSKANAISSGSGLQQVAETDDNDHNPGSNTLRRSARTRASKVDNPLAATQSVKKKPGYIFEPIASDEDGPFVIPPRPKASRVRQDARQSSTGSEDTASTNLAASPSACPSDKGTCSAPDVPPKSPSAAHATVANAHESLDNLALPQPKTTQKHQPRPRPRDKVARDGIQDQERSEYEPIGSARKSMVLARSLASDSVPATDDQGVGDDHGDLEPPERRDDDSVRLDDSSQLAEASARGIGTEDRSSPALELEPRGTAPQASPRPAPDSRSSENTGSSSTLRSPPPPSPRAAKGPSSSLIDNAGNAEDDDDSTDSSGESGSDYSEQVALKRQKRVSKVGHEDVNYSEQDDDEDDRLLEGEAIPESDGPSATKRQRKPSRAAKGTNHEGRRRTKNTPKKDKGKERETVADFDRSTESSDANVKTNSQGAKNTPGPLSKEAKEKIAEAGAQFRALLLKYSAEYGKDFNEIAFTAGWSIRSGRKGNLYNVFKRWYPYTHEKPQSTSLQDWNKEMDAAYEKQLEGIDRNDRDACREVMQPIIDELALFEQDNQETSKVKSALSRVRRCKEQFVNMAKAYNNLQDIHVGGFIVYTGSNPSAKMHSVFFTGSDAMAELAKANNVSYGHVLDCIENGMRTIMLQKTSNFNLPPPVFGGGFGQATTTAAKPKTKRDHLRALVAALLREELNRHAPRDKQVKDFPWAMWVDRAYELQLCLQNWPRSVTAPGSEFRFKDLSQTQLENILGPVRTKAALKQWEKSRDEGADSEDSDTSDIEIEGYARRDAAPKLLKDVQIVPWADDMKALATGDLNVGDIPVVVGRDGQALRLVKDGKAWMKESHPRARKSRKRRAQSPDPMRHSDSDGLERSALRDESQRPSKRPRADPTVHLPHQTTDIGSQERPQSAVTHAMYQRHEYPTPRQHNPDPVPLAGPSRIHETPSLYPVHHATARSTPVDMTSTSKPNIDATLAAARAKLAAVQKRREDQAKRAELQKINEALLALGEDEDEYFADSDVF